MSVMTSQILKFEISQKMEKSKYLKNRILFLLQIKKFMNYTSRAT